MTKIALGVAAATAALVSFAGSASAAPWQSVNQREARLEMQIRQGARSGVLTHAEATSLRKRLHALERLEISFRRNGLTLAERRLLDQRFDALARSIRVQMADRQVRNDRFDRDHRF